MGNIEVLDNSKGIPANQLMIAYYEAYARLATAESTQESYKYALGTYQKYNGDKIPITFLGTRKMVDGLLADNIKPETINQYVGRLASVTSWAVKAGLSQINFLDANVFPRLRTVTKVHKNVTDEMNFHEILKSVANVRDKAMFVFLGVAGMRKSEVVNVNREDVTVLEDGTYKILVKQAKNGKQRWALVPADYAGELEAHLATVASGPLFTAERTGKRLNPKSVSFIVRQYAGFSPHKYRHRVAETLYQAGAHIDDIAEVLGNSVSVCARVYKGIDIKRQINTSNLLRKEG